MQNTSVVSNSYLQLGRYFLLFLKIKKGGVLRSIARRSFFISGDVMGFAGESVDVLNAVWLR